MLKKIAVTGGVASGKTTVCRLFQKLGASVVFADKIVHELLLPTTELGKQVMREFGTLDRKALAKQVFQDPKKLQRLEALIHPAVLKQIEEEYKKAKGSCFVVEIPLLYEIGAEAFYDVVVAVVAEEKIAKKRFVAQGFEENEFALRMQRQRPLQEKSAKADYTLRNESTLEELESQVIALQKKILSH